MVRPSGQFGLGDRNLNEYTTLSALRTYLTLGSADTTDDTTLKRFLKSSSRSIDKFTRRFFYPKRKTLFFDIPRSEFLKFRDDLLQVKGLSDLNGASEIDSAAYFLQCGQDHNLTPFDRVVLFDNTGSRFNFSGTDQKAVHVDSILGYHEDYDNAWIDSGASLTSLLASQVTLASVSGSAGENILGLSPRFSTEQIWRLSAGASNEEYVAIQDTAPVTDGSVVRMIRGVNGTTAASHAASETVEVFDVEPDIEFCTRRLSSWQYEQSRSPFTGTVILPNMGAIEMPESWPQDVREKLKRFKKSRVLRAF